MTDNTNDLMAKLKTTDDTAELDRYLEQIRDRYPKDLSSYIKTILEEKGMSIADMQKKSGIDRTYIYQIMDGRKNPGRDKIIAMAVACRMTLPECQRALEIAQEGILYPKGRRDSVIIYAVCNKMNVMELNGLLEEYKLPPLE
ncbi:MAG: helix-turn-helix transcriptional regulator [Clostridiales bacterium]|nr:helix-turn-helix transcriptional regulator [Clostridiales bacterium]